MHIAHVMLTARFAGSERYAIELANAQSAHHRVSLILRRGAAGAHPGAFAKRADQRVHVVLVPDHFAHWHARQALRRLRPEVAHAHLGAACRALHRLDDVALRVASLHIRYKPHQHAKLDALVAIAPWQLEDIPAPLREHTRQIDNWTLPFRPSPDARARLRREHGVPPDAWVFGAIGRAEPSKGFDVLIEAFGRANLPNAYLVIVGQGQALAALRRQAGPRVLLPGFSDAPQDWLAAFDGFVSAARSEPYGLVLLEAMQARLPIIATRTDGALHLAPVMAPTLVPCDDADALASALGAMAGERPPRQSYDLRQHDLGARLAEFDAFYRAELARLRPDRTEQPPPPSPEARPTPSAQRADTMQAPVVELLAQDLNHQGGIFCPNPSAGMQLWSAHPKVYLDVARTGAATCPYCGTVYRLKAGQQAPSASH